MTSEQKKLKEIATCHLSQARETDKGKVLLAIDRTTTILVKAELVQTKSLQEQYRQKYIQKINSKQRTR